MKTRFSGMVKALAFGASFAMTFGLLACGDDSSSGASDNGSEGDSGSAFADIKADGCNFKKDDKVWKYTFSLKQQGIDSDAARYVEFNGDKTRDSVVAVSTGTQATQACKYMTGKETDEQEDDGIKVITAAWCEGKTFYSDEVRVGEFKGMSRSEAFDMVMKECEILNDGADKVNSSSSKGSKSSSSGKSDGKSSSSSKSEPQYENPFTDLKVGECNFKIDDKTWQYVTYSDNFGLGDEYKLHYYKYKEGGSIDSTYTYTFGSSARTLCRLDGDKDTSYTNNYGAKVHFKSWCTSNGMEEFEILKNTDQDKDREDAFDIFMTWCKIRNDIESSSSSAKSDAKSSSSAKDGSSSSAKKGESCKFKVDDEVWYAERDYADQGISEYYMIVTWDGNKASSKTVIAQKNQSASLCQSTLSVMESVQDNPGEKNEYACDGSTFIKTTTTDPFQYSSSEKKQYYESIMVSWCNKIVDASSSSAKSSSSSAKSSSSSAKSSSSSKKTEPTYPTQYGKSCKFTQDDNAWYVEKKDNSYYAVYEWTGNNVKETAAVFLVTDDSTACESEKKWLDCDVEGNTCTCDENILIMESTVEQENVNKTETFASVMDIQCGIKVEIESSSSAEEESSSSSAVSHCSFEKTANEWTFVSEDVTEIYTWDGNNKYVYTHISMIAFEGDEFYEGCEECKTAQQYCQEDADNATAETPEDDYFKYTYTCKNGVMTTTSVSKGAVNENRDDKFEELCLD